MTKHNVSLDLNGSWNSRDVATLTNIKPGILLRSANLAKLSVGGQQKLSDLNVTDVIDLRSKREVENYGNDQLPSPINFHYVPIESGDVSKAKGLLGKDITENIKTLMTAPGANKLAEKYMIEMYRQMLIDPENASQFIKALKIISNSKGATLVHCTAGKDRTGVLSLLVLRILGINMELIYEDYLYSNNSIDTLVKHVTGVEDITPFMRSTFGTQKSYLDTAWSAMEDHYGSFDNFLNSNEFSKEDIEKLRSKFN